MCTVSWRREAGGYELWFNRDELHARAPELPPGRLDQDGVALLAPRDGERGGTWLLANARGLTLGLLNDYANPWRPREGLSRGSVPLAGGSAGSLDDVSARVRALQLERIAPFHLIALASDGEPLLLHWDGARLGERREAAVVAPLSSSSFATAEVIAARVARFASFPELSSYHRQHDPRAGAHSVLMRRPDAATRSICRVRVDAGRVRLDYEAVAWGERGPAFTLSSRELPRSDRG